MGGLLGGGGGKGYVGSPYQIIGGGLLEDHGQADIRTSNLVEA